VIKILHILWFDGIDSESESEFHSYSLTNQPIPLYQIA